jgi:polysaccharide export outer membrane protein
MKDLQSKLDPKEMSMRNFFSSLALCLSVLQLGPAHAQARGPADFPPPPVADSVPGVPMSAASSATAGRSAAIGTLASLGADYRRGPHALMDVEVFGVPDLKRTVRVNSSGQVSLALVGNVLLAGLSAQQAETVIAEKYAEKYLQNPQVSVFIKEFTTQRITIEGAVAKPGIYPVTGQVTLLRALALAGGGAAYSDLSDIMVFRVGQNGSKTTQTHDLDKIRAGELPDPFIVADDVIVVKRNPVRAALRDSLLRDVIDSINPFSALSPR